MGKLRERRKKDKQKKVMTKVGVISAAACIVLIAFVIWINGGISNPADGDIAKEDSTQKNELETQIETEVTEATEVEPETLQLVMVGDMLMHEKIVDTGLQEDGT